MVKPCGGTCPEWADEHRMWFNERGLLIKAERKLAEAREENTRLREQLDAKEQR